MANNFNFSRSGYVATQPYTFNFGVLIGVFELLKGTSNNFVAVWADVSAGLSSGKFYVSSRDTLNIIDLETNTVYDYYTQTYGGRANEVLSNNDIEDINIGS